MGIIGYDGRLRPAGRALSVGAPNGFDIGAVEKIGNAQPKFVADVMKLYDAVSGGANKYGSALAHKEKRMGELADQEAVMGMRERIEGEKRKIEENETLTPEQKAEMAKGLTASFDSTGDDERNRRLALRGREMTFTAANSIYSHAKAQEQRAKDASFGAFMVTEEATIVQSFNDSLPKLLSGVSGINDIGSVVDKFVEDSLNEKDSAVSEEKRPVYDKFKAGLKARLITALGGAYTKQKDSEIEDGVNTVIAGVSAGAENISGVQSAVEGVLDAPEAAGYYTNTKRRGKITGAMISYTENGISRVKEGLSANVEIAKKNLSLFLASGDTTSFNEAVAGMNTAINSEYGKLLKKVEDERGAVISSIEGDTSLSAEQKNALVMFAKNKYDGFVRDINKSKANMLTSFRKDSELTKKKVGEDNFGALQKLFRGQDVELPVGAMTVFNLINRNKPFVDEFNAINKPVDGVLSAYLAQSYPGMDEALATKAAVLDFQHSIADLNMNKKGEQNLYAIETILSNAAILFGFDSSEYQQVASFARENMIQEKNDKANETRTFLDVNFYHGDKGKWENSATAEEKYLRDRVETFLREVDDSQWGSVSKRLEEQIEVNRRFNMAMTAGEIPGRVKAAQLSASSPSTEAKVGVAVNESKTFVESLYDTYADNPEELAQAIVQHRQKPIWEQNFAEYEYRAELAGDKAELNALKRGRNVKQAEAERAAAVNGFWRDSGREFGAYYHGRFESHGMQGKQAVIDGLKKRAEQEEKDKEKRAKYDNERAELLRALEAAGLPLSRKEYNSFFGIGGYPVNDSDELELWGAVREDRELFNSEIRKVLEQFGKIRKKEGFARSKRAVAEKRIAELEAKMK